MAVFQVKNFIFRFWNTFNWDIYSSIDITEAQSIESICSTIKCDYPGSYCTLGNGTPRCICETINCKSNKIKVCAEDGQTYASYCDLMKSSCAKQMPIKVKYSGQCSQGILKYIFLKLISHIW